MKPETGCKGEQYARESRGGYLDFMEIEAAVLMLLQQMALDLDSCGSCSVATGAGL